MKIEVQMTHGSYGLLHGGSLDAGSRSNQGTDSAEQPGTVTATALGDAWGGWEPECHGAARRPQRLDKPRILLTATLRWPLAARLAIAFHKLGCTMEVWCPEGHPLEKTRAAGHIYRRSAWTPLRSLKAAISASAPDLIVACDDDAAMHLHHLYQRCQAGAAAATPEAVALRRLIERSLGTPAACAVATDRAALMDLAAEQGVRIPPCGRLNSAADLDHWSARYGFPAVLKVDGSWGGGGVEFVADIQRAQCGYRAAARPALRLALSQWVLRRDPSLLMRRFLSRPPAVTVQKLVVGRPANRAVVCWQGEVLAGISVIALETQGPTGPATVVQVVDNAEMSVAAISMVRALGLSGFCGLDFVVEAATGAAYLIEVNPRATPISHLALGKGRNLPAALQARMLGEPPPACAAAINSDVIAMFPGEWRRDQASPYLRTAFHDVPWAEIDLVDECVEQPWEQRGIAARIKARLLPRRLPSPAATPSRGIEGLG